MFLVLKNFYIWSLHRICYSNWVCGCQHKWPCNREWCIKSLDETSGISKVSLTVECQRYHYQRNIKCINPTSEISKVSLPVEVIQKFELSFRIPTNSQTHNPYVYLIFLISRSCFYFLISCQSKAVRTGAAGAPGPAHFRCLFFFRCFVHVRHARTCSWPGPSRTS